MIDIPAARAGLASILTDVAPEGSTVEPAGSDALAVFPSVFVGMPAWNADGPTYGISTWTFPVAVVVDRAGTAGDSASIDLLDQTWPVVLAGLRSKSEADPGLGGICAQSVITRATFGLYRVQGTDYPAQLIFIDLYG